MKRVESRLLPLLLVVFAALLTCACGGDTYCQSGPKYGTQCHTINDVEWQRTQQREEPWPTARTTDPSPGCVVMTPGGVRQRPSPASSGAPATLPPPYLMSAACASRQQPVYGAVR
jgi:hypothetical protein